MWFKPRVVWGKDFDWWSSVEPITKNTISKQQEQDINDDSMASTLTRFNMETLLLIDKVWSDNPDFNRDESINKLQVLWDNFGNLFGDWFLQLAESKKDEYDLSNKDDLELLEDIMKISDLNIMDDSAEFSIEYFIVAYVEFFTRMADADDPFLQIWWVFLDEDFRVKLDKILDTVESLENTSWHRDRQTVWMQKRVEHWIRDMSDTQLKWIVVGVEISLINKNPEYFTAVCWEIMERVRGNVPRMK